MDNKQYIGIMGMLGMLIGVGIVNIIWLTKVYTEIVRIYFQM